MVDPKIDEIISGIICRLAVYSTASFNLLATMHVEQNNHISTMGVRVHDGQAVLEYNPEFVSSLSDEEICYSLIHETLHLLLHHCTFRSSNDPGRHYLENVAMDLAVNSLIHESIGVKMPRFTEDDEFGHKKGDPAILLPSMFQLEEKLSFEQYLDLLEKKFPSTSIVFICTNDASQSGNGKSGKSIGGKGSNGDKSKQDSSNSNGDQDGGDKDGDGNGSGQQDIDPNSPLGKITYKRISNDHGNGYSEDSYVDDFIKNFVEYTDRNNTWGDMFGNDCEVVKRAQNRPISWEHLLRFDLGTFINFQKEQSRRRWDKHYGKPFLGYKYKSIEPAAVYADTSASVGTHWLSRFVLEIEHIAYYTQTFLWSFDTQVQDPEKLVSFSRQRINSIKFKGRGGTDFNDIFDHARKHGMRHIVILTDGYAEDVEESQIKGLDVIWCITKDGCTTGKPGRVVEMK